MNVWSGLLAYNTPNTGRHQLPHLAIHILSIIANSAGCERLFSEMGHIHTKRRNRLSYQKVFDTAVVRMDLKRQHAVSGLTRTRLRREFGISIPSPDVAHSPDIETEKDQHDETGEEIAEIDMLDEEYIADSMATLSAKLRQDLIDDEDPPEDELENIAPATVEPQIPAPKRLRLFFGTQNAIMLKDMFEYNSSAPKGQGLDNFLQGGLANLQKELEIYDLATREMCNSIMYDDLQI
jgi:hypothetical protein